MKRILSKFESWVIQEAILDAATAPIHQRQTARGEETTRRLKAGEITIADALADGQAACDEAIIETRRVIDAHFERISRLRSRQLAAVVFCVVLLVYWLTK
jgi:hypothetical protein